MSYGQTGCLPRETKVGDGTFPMVGDAETIAIKDPSEWHECSLRHHVWNIHNQGQQNSCCPTAYAGLLETVREMQGLERIELSQAYPYRYANHGRDQGASLDSVFGVIKNRGITPASVVAPHDWRGRNWPDDVHDQAAKLRIVEEWDCVNAKACGTMVDSGWPVVLGVRWGRGGHAIYIVGLRKRGNAWDFEIVNSWGREWGDGGFGWLPWSQVESGIKIFGAWCPRFQRVQDFDPMPARPK